MENIEAIKKHSHKKLSLKDIFDKYYYVFFACLLLLIAFFCFYNIWGTAINDYDEARHGINAYEMLREKNYIANFYNGSEDYWNLKPPISYWLIIIAYKIFGYNTFSLRFFSALSYLITCVLISLFLKKNFGKLQSLCSLLVLLSYQFLFTSHCVRTGDADALFLLFYTVALISLFNIDKNPNYIYLTGIMFGLCFLTKSWHAFILAPTVFFYLLFTKGFKKIKWWRLILFFFFCIVLIAAWAIARYCYDGITFFKGMVEYDLLNRSSNVIEGHYGTIFYYVKILFSDLGAILAMLAIGLSILMSIVKFIKTKRAKTVSEVADEKAKSDATSGATNALNLFKLCLIAFLSTFIIYTCAKSKLYWYVFPCFIALALYAPIAITKLSKLHKIIPTLFVICFACVGVVTMVSISKPYTSDSQNFISSIENVKSVEIYFVCEDDSDWSQAKFLMAELKLDAYCRFGGYDAFMEDEDAYLILSNKLLQNYDTSALELVQSDENYSLFRHQSS